MILLDFDLVKVDVDIFLNKISTNDFFLIYLDFKNK